MIVINNKELKFKFGFKAAYLFEKETGKSLSQLGNDMSLETIIILITVAFQAAGEQVDEDFVVDAIDQDPNLINEFMKKIQEGMAAFNGLNEKAKKSRPR